MRSFYNVLNSYRETKDINVITDYLKEMVIWFFNRVPYEKSITSLCKQLDRDWVSLYKRLGAVYIDGIEYYFTEDSFRQTLAQSYILLPDKDSRVLIKNLFNELKWDFYKYVNPVKNEEDIYYIIDVSDFFECETINDEVISYG